MDEVVSLPEFGQGLTVARKEGRQPAGRQMTVDANRSSGMLFYRLKKGFISLFSTTAPNRRFLLGARAVRGGQDRVLR